ncbi:hypothetical protein D3C75_968380 [compost metagenome]
MHQLVALRQHGQRLLHRLPARRIGHRPGPQLQDGQLPLPIVQQRLQLRLLFAAPHLLNALLLHQSAMTQLGHLLQPVEILLQQAIQRPGRLPTLLWIERTQSRHQHGFGVLHLATRQLGDLPSRRHQTGPLRLALRHQGQSLSHQPALLTQIADDALAELIEAC